jgi:hypothetical protein
MIQTARPLIPAAYASSPIMAPTDEHAIAAGEIPFRPTPPVPRRAQFHVRGRLKTLQAP